MLSVLEPAFLDSVIGDRRQSRNHFIAACCKTLACEGQCHAAGQISVYCLNHCGLAVVSQSHSIGWTDCIVTCERPRK